MNFKRGDQYYPFNPNVRLNIIRQKRTSERSGRCGVVKISDEGYVMIGKNSLPGDLSNKILKIYIDKQFAYISRYIPDSMFDIYGEYYMYEDKFKIPDQINVDDMLLMFLKLNLKHHILFNSADNKNIIFTVLFLMRKAAYFNRQGPEYHAVTFVYDLNEKTFVKQMKKDNKAQKEQKMLEKEQKKREKFERKNQQKLK